VPRILTEPVGKRPAAIVREHVKRLKDGSADADKLVTISEAATRGTDDEIRHGYGPYVTGLMLESIAKARAGEFADAKMFVVQMKQKGRLSPEQQIAWTEAVDGLRSVMPDADAKEQLTILQAAILDC
jgi:hypothetical protein